MSERAISDVETDLIGERVAWVNSGNFWNTHYEGRIRGVVVGTSCVKLIVEPDSEHKIFKGENRLPGEEDHKTEKLRRRLVILDVYDVTLLDNNL